MDWPEVVLLLLATAMCTDTNWGLALTALGYYQVGSSVQNGEVDSHSCLTELCPQYNIFERGLVTA